MIYEPIDWTLSLGEHRDEPLGRKGTTDASFPSLGAILPPFLSVSGRFIYPWASAQVRSHCLHLPYVLCKPAALLGLRCPDLSFPSHRSAQTFLAPQNHSWPITGSDAPTVCFPASGTSPSSHSSVSIVTPGQRSFSSSRLKAAPGQGLDVFLTIISPALHTWGLSTLW